MTARVVAFDPAMRMGVAWSDDGQVAPERSIAWDLSSFKAPGDRYVAMLDRMKALPFVPTHVAWEASFSKSVQATRWLHGYRVVAELYAAWVGAEFLAVAPTTLRKWATGIGLASKAEREANPNIEKDRMRAAAIWKWPEQELLARIDQNRIDALWVLAWGLEQVS